MTTPERKLIGISAVLVGYTSLLGDRAAADLAGIGVARDHILLSLHKYMGDLVEQTFQLIEDLANEIKNAATGAIGDGVEDEADGRSFRVGDQHG